MRLRVYKNPKSTSIPFRHLSQQRAEEQAEQERVQQQRAREDADLRQQQAEVLRQQQQLQQQQQQQQQQELTDNRLRETVERLDKVVLEHGQTIALLQAQHDIHRWPIYCQNKAIYRLNSPQAHQKIKIQ